MSTEPTAPREQSTPPTGPRADEIVAPERAMEAVSASPWLTLEQLAAYLRVTPLQRGVRLIQRLMVARQIPFHTLGEKKLPRFHRDEIDRWLLERGTPLEEIA